MTFAERLRERREACELKQELLAELVSVEKMSISKYESGEMMPSSSTLIALSLVLEVDINYFFRETVPLKTQPEFRMSKKSEKLGETEQMQIIAQTQDALERQLEILEICQCQGEYVVDTSLRRVARNYEDIEALSLDVRDAWKLGLDPIGNLMEVAESHGFKIFLVDGPESFDAAVFTGEECGPIISLRRGAPKERQRFSLAHELGHYFIQKESVGYQDRDVERMAHRFAAAFLMPKELLVRDVGQTRKSMTPKELYSLRDRYGASTDAILIRMAEVNIISPNLKWQLWDLNKVWSSRPPGKAYSDTEMPRLMQKLVDSAFAEGLISERKGRELLGADGGGRMSYGSVV